MAGSKILGGGVRAHVYRYGGCACSCVQIWRIVYACMLMVGPRSMVSDSASFSLLNTVTLAKLAILFFELLFHWSCWYCTDAASLPVVRE